MFVPVFYFCGAAFVVIFAISVRALTLNYGRDWWLMSLLASLGFFVSVSAIVFLTKTSA